MGNVGNTHIQRSSVVIDLDKGNKVNESSFRNMSGAGGVSFDYASWLSLGVNTSTEHKESSMLSTQD
jgi:hypothetical protein